MNLLTLLPVILSFLLLGAHFYRAGALAVAVLCTALPLLLFLRRPWVPRLFQVLLALGALEWLHTLYVLAALRVGSGEPWMRLAVILGVVAAFTALSGLVLRSRGLRSWFGNRRQDID